MDARRSVVLLTLALFAAEATNVQQCPGRSFGGLSDSIELIPCKKLPCKLKKGSDQHINIKFTPEKDMKSLVNHVTGKVLGLEVPFFGVDGASICDKLYTESGDKTSCPVKAGTTYIYKDSFPILGVYPNVNVKVHWELKDGHENEMICFEVPARISN